jgi:biotin operon repressor
MTMTQCEALSWYLRKYPGASSLEVTHDLKIVNVTGRVSDLRAQGVEVVCFTREDGNKGYRIVEPETQLALAL